MIKQGDCLELMKEIPDGSVDMILTDLPYGITDCAWDKSTIDLDDLWVQFKRILKPYCSAVLFASGKFTHKLIASNWDWFKYKWIWVKNAPTMFVHAKNAPMRRYEEIVVLSDGVINHASVSKRRMKYNPQGLIDCEILKDNEGKSSETQIRSDGDFITFNNRRKIDYSDEPSQLRAGGRGERWTKSVKNATHTQIHNPHPENTYIQTQTNYPNDVIYFDEPPIGKLQRGKRKFGSVVGERPSHVDYYIQEQTGYPDDILRFNALPKNQRYHPTQKPVDLLEYLIKTYTNEGETVLDATMGSGSTGVACVNTNREFIGFELEEQFFKIAEKRIAEAVAVKAQSLF